MSGVKSIECAVDSFEVRVKTVCGAEEDGLVDCHCEDYWLGEEDFERADHATREFRLQGAIVLVGHAVPGAGGGGGLVVGFAGFEDGRGVSFFKEEIADYGIEGADDGKDPEDPAPAQVFNDDTTKEGAQGRTKKGSKEIPTEYAAKFVNHRGHSSHIGQTHALSLG